MPGRPRQLPQAGVGLWSGWKQILLTRRLERKTIMIRENLEQNRQHWDQTAWWLMARSSAISGGKYRLPSIHEPLLSMRMRPGNFPAVRLAQLAALLY